MSDPEQISSSPGRQVDDMQIEAGRQPESPISRYIGPLVVGAFAAQATIAGGISEVFGAESAADASFTFAAGCAIGALGGALFAYRKSRRNT